MKYAVGSGRTALCYEIRCYGLDILIHIDGGISHIGSISAGKNGEVTTHVFPEHKEQYLTEPLAREISRAYNGNVVVTAGVHLDQISEEEIEEILSLHEKAIPHITSLLEQKECEHNED
jgi:hypothetical protein